MRFWFDHSSEVTLREQITTQIRLGILSGELAPGERLPSIREIARRFRVHSNTVSAAYAQLRQESWVVHRRGSGVFVRGDCSSAVPYDRSAKYTPSVEQAILEFLRTAEQLGVSRPELRERILKALDAPLGRELLLIEPDCGLRRIVCHELSLSLGVTVATLDAPLNEIGPLLDSLPPSVLPLVLPSKAEAVRTLLRQGAECVVLQINPVAATFSSYLPASRSGLIGIASCWPMFLEISKVMLTSAGYPSECLVLRNTGEPNWLEDLQSTDAIICDTLTAGIVSGHARVLCFAVVAEISLRQLHALMHASATVAHQELP